MIKCMQVWLDAGRTLPMWYRALSAIGGIGYRIPEVGMICAKLFRFGWEIMGNSSFAQNGNVLD